MKKVLTIIIWFLIVVSTAILALTAYFVYPIAFVLRKPIRKLRSSKYWILKALVFPLWIYLDDEDGDFGAMWWRQANGYNLSFKTAYKWSVIRNPIWNIHTVIQPKQGFANITDKIIDKLHRNGKKVSPFEFARYRWIDVNGYEDSNSNTGYGLSIKNSIIGTSYIFYKVRNRLYFRYSTAREINLFGLKRLLQIKLGTNENRYLVQLKLQKTP